MSKANFIVREKSGDSNKRIPVTVESKDGNLYITPKGYGDACSKDGHGTPIMLELWEGQFRLVVWSDIMSEDPTHAIDLKGAREDRPERVAELKLHEISLVTGGWK